MQLSIRWKARDARTYEAGHVRKTDKRKSLRRRWMLRWHVTFRGSLQSYSLILLPKDKWNRLGPNQLSSPAVDRVFRILKSQNLENPKVGRHGIMSKEGPIVVVESLRGKGEGRKECKNGTLARTESVGP